MTRGARPASGQQRRQTAHLGTAVQMLPGRDHGGAGGGGSRAGGNWGAKDEPVCSPWPLSVALASCRQRAQPSHAAPRGRPLSRGSAGDQPRGLEVTT